MLVNGERIKSNHKVEETSIKICRSLKSQSTMERFLILISIIAQLSGASFGFPMEVSPEEMGDFFEGDMDLSLEQTSFLQGNSRAGVLLETLRWPSSPNGIVSVPYQFQSGSLYCESGLQFIN